MHANFANEFGESAPRSVRTTRVFQLFLTFAGSYGPVNLLMCRAGFFCISGADILQKKLTFVIKANPLADL